MMSERISVKEVIQIYKIEDHFLNELISSDLLHPETENSTTYIVYEELHHLERFANWHYDLEINLPGIEIIHKLLNQLEDLRHENRRLSEIAGKLSSWEDAEF